MKLRVLGDGGTQRPGVLSSRVTPRPSWDRYQDCLPDPIGVEGVKRDFLNPLEGIPDPEAARRERARKGVEGLVRFARQLVTTPEEAASLPGGRTGAVPEVQDGIPFPRPGDRL